MTSILLCHCKQLNKLDQDEETIIDELSTLEALQVEETIEEKKGSYLNFPEAPRTEDPAQPVVVLDILKARNDVRNIKTADLFSKIRYVPAKFLATDDTLAEKFGGFEFHMTPNNIIASHFTHGISQLDHNGNFLKQIVKNTVHYSLMPGKNLMAISKEDMKMFVGNSGDVHTFGDKIYYQYRNYPKGYGAMMMYDASPLNLSPMLVSMYENAGSKPKGSEVFQFPVRDENFRLVFSITSFNSFPINEQEWASTRSVMKSSKSGYFLSTTNLSGDTLTKFQDHDPITNYTGSVLRSTDSNGDHYSYQGQQHVRQAHNDTIYILAQSNKLIPKYVLNFGDKGIQSTMEGIDPRISLKEKYIIREFVESNRYLFITYTQNVPSPNSARKKEVFYNSCIYNKNSGAFFHIYIDQPPHIPEGRRWPKAPRSYIENNINDGPSFWPKQTTHDGFPFTWISGKTLQNDANFQDADYLLMIAY